MKSASLLLGLLLTVHAWADTTAPAGAPAPPPAAAAAAARPSLKAAQLKFVKVPLGNVARVLSARFSVQVSITANAKAPITGDFSHLDLRPALAEAARQAGLVVTALGSDPSAGFSLGPPTEAKAAPAQAVEPASDDRPSESTSALDEAARQRSELLRLRATLQEQSVPSDPQT